MCYYEPEYENEEIEEYMSEIEEIISKEVESRHESLIKRIESLEQLNKSREETIKGLKAKNRILEDSRGRDEIDARVIDAIRNRFNEGTVNLYEFIKSLGFKRTLSVGYSTLKEWKKIVLEYYDNKDIVFDIFDAFGVNYNADFKDYVLPRYLEKDELFNLIKKGRFCGTNGEYLSNNYRYLTHEVPIQELLMNKNILSDDIMDFIINKLSNSEYKPFYAIGSYMKLNGDYIKRITETIDLSRRLSTFEEKFIKKHENQLFDKRWFYDLTCKRINLTNQYNLFYLGKYSSDLIVEYLAEQEKPLQIFSKLERLESEKSTKILQGLAKLI